MSYGGGGYGGDRGYDRRDDRGDRGYDRRDDRGGSSYGGGGGGGDNFGSNWDSKDLGKNLRNINWNSVSLIKFEKDFYQEHPAVTAMGQQEADDIRRRKIITVVSGRNCPKPVRTFEEASFPDYVLDELHRAGFKEPSPIQVQGW